MFQKVLYLLVVLFLTLRDGTENDSLLFHQLIELYRVILSYANKERRYINMFCEKEQEKC